MEKTEQSRETARGYIIALSKWRSRLALAAGLVTFFVSLYAIAGGIVQNLERGLTVQELFHWFTINSNSLTAFSAGMIIPFAVEGIRKKHFSYPKWVAMFHYSGMVCTTLTMVFSMVFMSWVDPEAAFGGYNTYLHILCPIMVLISFFLVESGFHFTLKESLIAMVPTVLYEMIYMVEVVIIGEEKGGWKDMYHMTEYVPFVVSVVGVPLLALAISLLIRRLYNRMVQSRRRKMAAGFWPEDVNPVEINIEIFGLGRYMGRHADEQYVELPLELINSLADRYHLKAEELTRPYVRGFLDSLKDRRKKQQNSACERKGTDEASA